MHSFLPAVLLGVALAPALFAQDPVRPASLDETVPGSYIVMFETRSFGLERFREAIRADRPATEVAEIVRDMESAVRSDQAPFVAAVESLGGRVTEQWWIINAAAVDGIFGDAVAALGRLDNVSAVEPNRVIPMANGTARNATHHEADQANTRRNATNQLITGTGVSVAVVDTGVDGTFGATGLPNPGYFVGANTANTGSGGIGGSRLKAVFGTSGRGTEDDNGHGTHCSGSVGSGYSGYRGIAPDAWIVGVKISTATNGNANSTTMVSAWQLVAAERQNHNIRVASNSYSGSPSLTDPIQQALDSTAFNADILATVAAGNGGTNTSGSQNGWNGLAVGSIVKNTLAVSSFSGRGPLASFGRTYPDITAVGSSVNSMSRDTTASSNLSGTSMATPMVAGGAALLRQAVPALSALETKAILLNSTKHTQNQRNSYGLGVMDCDQAVQQALAGEYHTVTLSGASGTYSRTFTPTASGAFALTATWMHPPGGTFDNVDMRVFQGTTLVASDLNTLNSYESVDFNVVANTTYRLELRRVGTPVVTNLQVAIAGLADTPVLAPSLTAISPGSVSNNARETITLDGVLDRIDHIDVGSARITSYTQVSPTRITFQLPAPAVIAQNQAVTVTNRTGTSNALALDVTGTHPIQLTGPTFVIRNFPVEYTTVGDANWGTFLFLSNSNQPSVIPNVVNLGIGNNFSVLFDIGFATQDSRGQARFGLTVPSTVAGGLYYLQAVTFDPTNLAPPLEVSNSLQSQVF